MSPVAITYAIVVAVVVRFVWNRIPVVLVALISVNGAVAALLPLDLDLPLI